MLLLFVNVEADVPIFLAICSHAQDPGGEYSVTICSYYSGDTQTEGIYIYI